MNLEKLLALMPTEVVKEEDVNNRIETEREIINAGTAFVSRLSINRFAYTKLVDLDITQRLNLFKELEIDGFVYMENGLYFHQIDVESFEYSLKEKFKIEDVYTLDNFYLENLLKGRDVTEESIDIYDESLNLQEVLERIVFSIGGMNDGDTPNLQLMLVVKKALIGTYLAEQNVESLLSGKREIYDISILE